MDPKSNKPRDFVAINQNMTEEIKKTQLKRMAWFEEYGWLLEEYKKMGKEISEICKKKHATFIKDSPLPEDKRTCFPLGLTTNSEYGWLTAKPDFQLEKYGSYVPYYPDPLKNIAIITGDVPLLAAGKGFIR